MKGIPARLQSARIPQRLLALYGAIWLALALQPKYRQDWVLENLLVLVAIPLLIASYRRMHRHVAGCARDQPWRTDGALRWRIRSLAYGMRFDGC